MQYLEMIFGDIKTINVTHLIEFFGPHMLHKHSGLEKKHVRKHMHGHPISYFTCQKFFWTPNGKKIAEICCRAHYFIIKFN